MKPTNEAVVDYILDKGIREWCKTTTQNGTFYQFTLSDGQRLFAADLTDEDLERINGRKRNHKSAKEIILEALIGERQQIMIDATGELTEIEKTTRSQIADVIVKIRDGRIVIKDLEQEEYDKI